jgi:hypothetical protein
MAENNEPEGAEDLASFLEKSGPLDERKIRDALGELCDALAEAQQKGGARDGLKPEKIAQAKRAFDAVLDDDHAALASIAAKMPGAPPDAPVRAAMPGAFTVQSFPARGASSRAAGQASSTRWIGIAAGALLGVGALAAIGVLSYRYLGQERITATPCGQGALRLIGRLRGPVKVTLFATRGLPRMDRFVEQVSAMMRDLEASSNGKLAFEVVEVTTDEQRTRAKDLGLQESAFGEAGAQSESATIVRGFCGMAFEYGSEREAIAILSPEQTQGVPFWVVEKIREVFARADNVVQKFGVIAGKDEIKLTEPNLVAQGPSRGGAPSMKGIFAQAMPFYRIEEVDLRGGEAEIDPDLAGLMITQPGADFADKELRRIDQFLMRGQKTLLVFASAVNVQASDAKMTAELGLHGLDRLLDGYGVGVQKDALFDWESSMSIPFTQGSAPAKILAPSILIVQHDDKLAGGDGAQRLDNTFVPFFRLEEVAFPFASSLTIQEEKQPEARFRIVARSSSKTTAETAGPLSLRPGLDAAPRGDQKPRLIAVAAEGKLRSAFAGQPGDGISAPAASPESSRLLVVSSSQFLSNPMARAGNAKVTPGTEMLGVTGGDADLQMISQAYAQKYLTSTILVLKNTLDWASADDATVSCSALLVGPKEEKK